MAPPFQLIYFNQQICGCDFDSKLVLFRDELGYQVLSLLVYLSSPNAAHHHGKIKNFQAAEGLSSQNANEWAVFYISKSH